jgi:AcrR family transcriptional regulator
MTVQSNSEKTTRQQSAHDRRELILDCALALFAEHGVEGTSMKSLAKRAGISPGLIYHYFESKADLLDQVIEMRGVSFPELASFHDRSVDEVIPRFAKEFSKSVSENLDVVWIFFKEYRSSDTVAQGIGKRRDRCVASLSSYLEARQAQGEVRSLSSVVASRSLLGSLFQIHLTETPTAEFVDQLVEIFLTGIKA